MKIEDNNIINITDIAITKFKEMLLDSGKHPSYLKISLELEGTKMFYNIDVVEEYTIGDKFYNFMDLSVIINEEDEELLSGLIIDYISDEYGENFVIDNPNLITELENEDGTGGCGCGCGYC